MARYVRVVSLSFRSTGKAGTTQETIERNLKEMAKLLEKAMMDEPDIVCFPECSAMLGLGKFADERELVEAAEEMPGKIFQTMATLAEKYEMYIVCPMIEKRGGRVYNSAVLIDRSGTYLGSYHKIHPTIGEIESGITPGTEPKTFKLDFGTVGFAICFDLNFEDVIRGLTKNGAELVFFPSMYPGGLQLKMWAFNYGLYLVSAFTGERINDGSSMIVDPLGRVSATSSSFSPVICKTINLDYRIFSLDYNYEKLDSVKKKYGSKVELDVSLPESVFMLTSNLEGVTVEDIIREFQLETREKYFKRASKIREKAIEGKSKGRRGCK